MLFTYFTGVHDPAYWSCLLQGGYEDGCRSLPQPEGNSDLLSWRHCFTLSDCLLPQIYISFVIFCSLLSRRSMDRMPPMLVMRVVLLQTFRLAILVLMYEIFVFPSRCLGDAKHQGASVFLVHHGR